MDNLKKRIERKTKNRKQLLKSRAQRCRCKYCGGELELRQVILTSLDEAKVDIFCKNCNRLEFGVEPEIYEHAKQYVEETYFNCYSELEDSARVKQMNISKVCEIMTWITEGLGFVDLNGFRTEIQPQNRLLGECIVLSEDDVKQLKTTDEE